MASANESATTPSLETALAELPAKLRVHELAKRAQLSSKDTIAALAALGIAVSSAASSVGERDATALLTSIFGPAPAPGAQTPDAQVPSSEVPGSEVPEEAASAPTEPKAPARPKRSRKPKPAAAVEEAAPDQAAVPLFLPAELPEPAPARKPTRSRRGKAQVAEAAASEVAQPELSGDEVQDVPSAEPAAPAKPARRSRRRGVAQSADTAATEQTSAEQSASEQTDLPQDQATQAPAQEPAAPSRNRRRRRGADPAPADSVESAQAAAPQEGAGETDDFDGEAEQGDGDGGSGRRRRRRGRRGRGRVGDVAADAIDESSEETAAESGGDLSEEDEDSTAGSEETGDDSAAEDGAEDGESTGRRRRRRRRRGGAVDDAPREDDPDNTVVHVREARTSSAPTEVQGVRGSTRLEAKRQRRRDSRDSRRRPQILTEAEFLARRESVERVMAVRQRGDLAQVGLLEDGVLVEHFVSRAGAESMIGNIYLGRVQNVLPSMEAAFIDIGRGRNAVLYAGEVNWDAAGLAGKARRIETALTSGDMMLVQVSKDPVGHKGARLTTQISLPGRFLVYVPGGGATGISRKLPDTERKRLKSILDRIVPEDAGVIIRTAAEGVAEDELAADVERLKAQWEEIASYAERSKDSAKSGSTTPVQLSSEPDTLIKVVRDLFNSDITRLIVDGDEAFDAVSDYVNSVAPELSDRVRRFEQQPGSRADVFSKYRIDEQIAKALERKVHLPSGGSLVIDRTEAMTVVDVNTGKYTGSGGNLEETVTKNNLEAAEEIVRQLRLRDIGGIIVIDFIDMVLESNRELVLRRLTECLGRDRTRHQVAEVTSLGLVQMTRKKIGTGLVEAFSEPCSHCNGRGIILRDVPVDPATGEDDSERRSARRKSRSRQPEPVPELPKITLPVVRPPDPRGPKPPSLAGGGFAESDALQPSDVPAPEADADGGSTGFDEQVESPRVEHIEVGGIEVPLPAGHDQASASAPDAAGGDAQEPLDAASDAVNAVLAALDARAETSGEQTLEPAVREDAGGSGRGRRGRGRRAAGRPAGAPAAGSAVVLVVPAVGSTEAPNGAAPAAPAPSEPAPAAAADASDQSAPAKRRRRAASRPAGPAGQ